MSTGCGRHKFSGQVGEIGMPALSPQPPRLVDGDSGIVAHVHSVVVNPRRPLAGNVRLGLCRPARQHHEEQQKRQNRHRFALHLCESHPLILSPNACSRAAVHSGPDQRGSSARHCVGSHPEASATFLKCACVKSGSTRYCGSVVTVVTVSQVLFVYGSVNVS